MEDRGTYMTNREEEKEEIVEEPKLESGTQTMEVVVS